MGMSKYLVEYRTCLNAIDVLRGVEVRIAELRVLWKRVWTKDMHAFPHAVIAFENPLSCSCLSFYHIPVVLQTQTTDHSFFPCHSFLWNLGWWVSCSVSCLSPFHTVSLVGRGPCLIHLCNPGVQHHTGHIQDARETIRTELTRKGSWKQRGVRMQSKYFLLHAAVLICQASHGQGTICDNLLNEEIVLDSRSTKCKLKCWIARQRAGGFRDGAFLKYCSIEKARGMQAPRTRE